MRELKFRAWHKDSKYMEEVVMIDFIDNLIATSNDNGGYVGNIEEHVIMQYTGLKDKNDKKIYEGDICKYFKHDLIGTIEFRNCQWCFVVKNSVYHIEEIAGSKEVIGNIYENPELLEGN